MLTLMPLACVTTSSFPGLVVSKRHARFGIEKPLAGWHKKSFRGADLYLEHESKNASVFFNAQCEKISDSPLEALVAQLLVDMGKYEVISEKRLMLDNREALITEVNINLDGVKRYTKMMVYRKGPCVFDGVFNAPVHNELAADFDSFVQSFWAEAQ